MIADPGATFLTASAVMVTLIAITLGWYVWRMRRRR